MMRPIFSVVILTFLIIGFLDAHSQVSNTPNFEITGSINVGLLDGYPIYGPGTQMKALWLVGKNGNYLVAGIAFDRFMEEFSFDGYSYNFLLTSIGFRQKMRSIFIEPKLGFGTNIESGYNSFSFFGGIEPGIERKLFAFSLDYRFITSDGLFDGEHFHTLALRVAYKIKGGRK